MCCMFINPLIESVTTNQHLRPKFQPWDVMFGLRITRRDIYSAATCESGCVSHATGSLQISERDSTCKDRVYECLNASCWHWKGWIERDTHRPLLIIFVFLLGASYFSAVRDITPRWKTLFPLHSIRLSVWVHLWMHTVILRETETEREETEETENGKRRRERKS